MKITYNKIIYISAFAALFSAWIAWKRLKFDQEKKCTCNESA